MICDGYRNREFIRKKLKGAFIKLESPSFLADLLFSIDFKLLNTSSSDMIPSQLNVYSLVSLGKGMCSKYASILSASF